MEQNNTKKYLDKKSLIILILSLLLVGIGGFLLYDYKVAQIEEKYSPSPPQVVHDTITKDSIQIQEKIKLKYVTEYDTIIDTQIDTLMDTVYVQIPIGHYQYQDVGSTDSTKYSIKIDYSGYKASIDSVWFDYSYKPRTVTQIKRNGWGQHIGVGVHTGYGAHINVRDGTFITGPYIGIGVNYSWGYNF